MYRGTFVDQSKRRLIAVVSYCSMMANALLVKALSIANSYMNPVALSAIGWVSPGRLFRPIEGFLTDTSRAQRYYLVYTGLIVVQLIGWYVLAVDTNNLTLEGMSLPFYPSLPALVPRLTLQPDSTRLEIAVLFEGKNGAVPDPERAAAAAAAAVTHPDDDENTRPFARSGPSFSSTFKMVSPESFEDAELSRL